MTSEVGGGELYWVENFPVLLTTLAAMTPGMTEHDVAGLLHQLDQETMRSGDPECMDYSDDALIKLYLDTLV